MCLVFGIVEMLSLCFPIGSRVEEDISQFVNTMRQLRGRMRESVDSQYYVTKGVNKSLEVWGFGNRAAVIAQSMTHPSTIDYLDKRKSTSDAETPRNPIIMSDNYYSSDGPTLKSIKRLSLCQHASATEPDSFHRALSAVEAEAKQVDVIHARATSRRAPINKLPEQILAEIFEWCCLSIDWKHLSPERRRVNLLGVCHWWFVVLTNCASIWRHIHIPSGFYWLNPETVSMTRLRLERAKAAKITLSVSLFYNVSDEDRDPAPSHPLDNLLAKSFPRCEELEISYLSTRTGHSFIPLPPSELPNMASLSILWVRDRDVPRKTAPPALFPSHAAYQKLRELSLSIKTRTAFTEANIYADLFGLKTVDVSAITCLNIDFDSVPDGTWSVLEHFINLSKLGLRRIGAWQPWPHDDVHGSSGVTSQPIVLASLRTANIDYMPYFASLVRLKASHLEELVTRGPLESKERVHEEVVQESLTKGIFSLTPPTLLVTLRIVRRSNHYIPPEHWDNFFAVQKRLEILECACTHVFVERIHSVPEAFPRLRLLHLRAKSAFDKKWTTDLPIEDAQLLAYQIETLRPSVSAELPEDLPGLRVLVELDEGRDLSPLPDDLPLSRFRVMPYDRPWCIHPVWA
ncbi:hypothetical protein DL93DRAFT_2156816 [Clavulina sp. PMI_390]|nr:hypothetical protein DL93DRAFT_2156816 [Clavulina sp. PMI_390]